MSTFYSSGTVSVTNASTTATLSAAVPVVVEVQPGDLLAAGTGLAVIASINSARTQLTLARGWAAATVTAGNFEIILLADSIRTLNITSTLLADLRTGPLQGRFAAGTAGAPGVTSQAHQTSGLFWTANGVGLANNGVARVNPISGGLNLSGTVQANGSPVYTRANILGTVSQSGGVPAEAVIQRGSNANGEFARFADGTQICTHRIAGAPIQTAMGSGLYRSDAQGWVFPAAFAVAPRGVASPVGSGVAWGTMGTPGTTSAAQIRTFAAVSTASSIPVDVIAIGRWF